MAYVRKSVRDKQAAKNGKAVATQEKIILNPKEHKYVVYDKGQGPRSIVFSPDEIHRDVALRICGLDRVISAGFCQINQMGVICYGESESIGVKSRYEDAELIATF